MKFYHAGPAIHASNLHLDGMFLPPKSICDPHCEKDFCLWAPLDLDSTIGDTEAEVTWCTETGHGTPLVLSEVSNDSQLHGKRVF